MITGDVCLREGVTVISILSRPEMQLAEKKSCLELGVDEDTMISWAGLEIFRLAQDLLQENYPSPDSGTWVVVAGKGHNGADACEVALLAWNAGICVQLVLTTSLDEFSQETQRRISKLYQVGLPDIFLNHSPENFKIPKDTRILIDGLLGTGFVGPPREFQLSWIRWMNESQIPILSIDLPSGVESDTRSLSEAVEARWTLVLGSPKLSGLFYPTRSFYGKQFFHPLKFPNSTLSHAPSQLKLVNQGEIADWIPKHDPLIHKYQAGKILVIAGSLGMHGAALLSAKAALKSGAGLVKLAFPRGLRQDIHPQLLEIMGIPVGESTSDFFCESHIESLKKELSWADAVVLGPGLGKREETQKFLDILIPYISTPLVLDGDGLQALQFENIKKNLHHQTVLTPHWGEFSRYGIGEPSKDPQNDPILKLIEKVRTFSSEYSCTLVLKGPTTLICEKNQPIYCSPFGNWGLATAGTGDVLAGMIAAFLPHLSPSKAASLACAIHGLTANQICLTQSPLSLTANQLIEHLGGVLKKFSEKKMGSQKNILGKAHQKDSLLLPSSPPAEKLIFSF